MPVGIRTVRTVPYETVLAERSEEAAVESALYELRCRMEAEVPEGTLSRKVMRAELTEEAYILYCKAEYIENIARVQEIDVEGLLRNGAKNGND